MSGESAGDSTLLTPIMFFFSSGDSNTLRITVARKLSLSPAVPLSDRSSCNMCPVCRAENDKYNTLQQQTIGRCTPQTICTTLDPSGEPSAFYDNVFIDAHSRC